MIHDIGVELKAALRAKGCPFDVVDGPEESTTTTYARERIVIEHDDGDTFRPPMSQRANPKQYAIRSVAVKITIYAQSARAGSFPFEHRRRAERVLDMVLNALHAIDSARHQPITFQGGKFIKPADLAQSDRPAGAVYELSFSILRAIQDRTWDGDAQPEGEIASFGSTTQVTLDGVGTPEAACGS